MRPNKHEALLKQPLHIIQVIGRFGVISQHSRANHLGCL